MRFVNNPFLQSAEDGADRVDAQWLRERIEDLVPRIAEDAKDEERLEDRESLSFFHCLAGPYIGASGMAFALMQAATQMPNGDSVLRMADKILAKTSKANPARSAAKEARFLSGHLGLYTVRLFSFSMLQISLLRGRNHELEARVRAAGEAAAAPDFPWDEIFNGRTGFLAAALLLRYL